MKKIVIAASVILTNSTIFSINTIDKLNKVCYTKIKLENKIKILTNNTNKKENKNDRNH